MESDPSFRYPQPPNNNKEELFFLQYYKQEIEGDLREARRIIEEGGGANSLSGNYREGILVKELEILEYLTTRFNDDNNNGRRTLEEIIGDCLDTLRLKTLERGISNGRKSFEVWWTYHLYYEMYVDILKVWQNYVKDRDNFFDRTGILSHP